jgi:hypothetical protein
MLLEDYDLMYLAADSVCDSLFDIRSVLKSRQSTDKQIDVTGFLQSRLQAAFHKCHGRYNGLVCQYNLSVAVFGLHMLSDMLSRS